MVEKELGNKVDSFVDHTIDVIKSKKPVADEGLSFDLNFNIPGSAVTFLQELEG